MHSRGLFKIWNLYEPITYVFNDAAEVKSFFFQ